MFGDRISALPDDLIVEEILSLLSTKDVVATMILSKRWQFLWTMVPKLEYFEESEEKQQRLWQFIDESLQLHKAPILKGLYIELGHSNCPVPVDLDVGKWIGTAVSRKLRELQLSITYSAEPARLCKSLYTCDTLVFLYLCENILVDVPSSACLPSLKKLFLYYVMYKDEDSHVRLISNCPVLKFLGVGRDEPENVKTFIIKNPSLEYLLYDNYMDENWGSLVIDSPALKQVSFKDCSGDRAKIYVENNFCLDKAKIHVNYDNPDDKFMRSFSSVIHLDFRLTFEMGTWLSTINFSKLMECKIVLIEEYDWLETVMGLLQNSPKLKLLFLNQSPVEPRKDLSLSWNKPSSVPKCLSDNLEIVQWKGFIGTNKEKEVMRYILTNSKCLKRAVVSMDSTSKIQDEEKMKELESMFRISTSSKLLFSNQFEFPNLVNEMCECFNSD